MTVKNGKVTAVKKGTATVTVTTKAGAKASVKVTVSNPKTVKTTSLSLKADGLKKSKVSLKKGKKLKLAVNLTPSNSTQKITFSSSNKKVATVSSSGTIKGIKKELRKLP